MNNLLTKIKQVLERIRSFFPETLPQGLTHAEAWIDSIIRMAKLPNNDSIRFAVAVKVLHLAETDCYKSKEFFVRALKKAAANQVVSQIINDLKAKQQAEQQAAQAAAAAATVESTPVSDAQTPATTH